MSSPVPAKTQPLHNFDLPRSLKWKKDEKSSGHHQQRRSIKSPSRRPHPSPASPLRHSPLCDSVSAPPPPHRESPFRDSILPRTFSRESPDRSVRNSPIHGESSSKSARRSPIGDDSVKGSPVRGDSGCHFRKRDLVANESESSVKSKGVVIEYRRNHSKNSDFDGVRNVVVNSLKSGKFEKKPKAAEVDAAGIKRSSKILIKIPCKNKSEEEHPNDKPEEENPNNTTEEEPLKNPNNTTEEEPLKVEYRDEGKHTDQVQQEGKTENNKNSIDEEGKTWNLRPRKPIRKSLNVNGGRVAVRNHGSSMPEKGKAQSPSQNLNNKSGDNEGNGFGGGVEREKRKLSINISLTKEEIEEDIFAFTGAKPSRRPKKRPRNVQKQVDYVFPGLWLVSITPESYKVSESSMKG